MIDQQVKENDARVNQAVDRPEEQVSSVADYHALRKKWSQQTPTPKLMHSAQAPVLMDGDQNIKLLLSGEDSAGRFMVSLITLMPGFGPPPHHQPNEDELFLVVDGEVEITIGEVTQVVGKGDIGYAPAKTTHAFSAVGDKPAILFSINSPGGHERGFEFLSKAVANGEPVEEAMAGLVNYDFVIDELDNDEDNKRIGV